MVATDPDQLAINTIRTLSMDAVQQARSAPLLELQKKFGFEPGRVVAAAREQMARKRG